MTGAENLISAIIAAAASGSAWRVNALSDKDKNQHLSESLSEIQDYGPAIEEEYFDDYEGSDSEGSDSEGSDSEDSDDELDDDFALDDDEPEYTPQVAAAPARRKRGATIVLGVGLVLIAALTTATGFYFHSELKQVQQQLSGRHTEPPAPVFTMQEHTHPENLKLALMEQRMAGLEAQLSAMRSTPPVAATIATAATTASEASSDDRDGKDSPAEVVAAVADAPAEIATRVHSPEDRNTTVEPEPAVATTATPWFINLGSFQLESVARRWADRLENSPSPILIIPATNAGRSFYRVRIGGFASRAEAQTWAGKLKEQWQLDATWVGRE